MTKLEKIDIIRVHNPTDTKYTIRFNGEPYSIDKEETKTFSYFVGLHLAKHLSDKIIQDENPHILKKHPTEKEITREETRISQLRVFDNPKRRVALYRILEDTLRVQDVILSYNFKGFVGEMQIYRDFVKGHGDKFVERDPTEKKLTSDEKIDLLMKEVEELKNKKEETKKEEIIEVKKSAGRPKKQPEEVKPITE